MVPRSLKFKRRSVFAEALSSTIKNQYEEKEDEAKNQKAKIAKLKAELEELKKQGQWQLKEAETKTMGLAVALQHTVKSQENVLAEKVARYFHKSHLYGFNIG